jgi:hypothetical protein
MARCSTEVHGYSGKTVIVRMNVQHSVFLIAVENSTAS